MQSSLCHYTKGEGFRWKIMNAVMRRGYVALPDVHVSPALIRQGQHNAQPSTLTQHTIATLTIAPSIQHLCYSTKPSALYHIGSLTEQPPQRVARQGGPHGGLHERASSHCGSSPPSWKPQGHVTQCHAAERC